MRTLILSIFLLFIINICYCDLHPDVGLSVESLVTKYNYPFEYHSTITEDGYILSIHRISHSPKNLPNQENERRPVIFMLSGLWCNSGAWLLTGPEKSLGFLLADRGYDVWMGNNRGTTHSRNHTTLNPDKGSAFWDFSFDEMGAYDLPVMIDYVLNYTNQEYVTFIGHSQGSTAFFALLSERPEYNDKIKLAINFAPAVYLSSAQNPYLPYVNNNINKIKITLKLMGIHEILPMSPWIFNTSNKFCNDDAITQDICMELIFMFGGPSHDQFNKTLINVITTHIPAGASARQIYHLMQTYDTGLFRKYDFGKRKNNKIYGTPEPPTYNVSKVTVPTFLYAGGRDWMADVKDVTKLSKELPNSIGIQIVDNMSHIDFVWAIDVVPLVYESVFEILEKYT
ncbi:lipase 3-like isoform X2 [Chrysoperla carnea]|uniref:lipase 3-like isoform X2 n=1 Tax=Chrysoperla carnea TaxID=189513 RepID=UPI001D05E2C6|nr:lipase 3-like isoform X2 [Chrysoperla carnea]